MGAVTQVYEKYSVTSRLRLIYLFINEKKSAYYLSMTLLSPSILLLDNYRDPLVSEKGEINNFYP
jgi:hypothetical protein